jgi:hypothetical protein
MAKNAKSHYFQPYMVYLTTLQLEIHIPAQLQLGSIEKMMKIDK